MTLKLEGYLGHVSLDRAVFSWCRWYCSESRVDVLALLWEISSRVTKWKLQGGADLQLLVIYFTVVCRPQCHSGLFPQAQVEQPCPLALLQVMPRTTRHATKGLPLPWRPPRGKSPAIFPAGTRRRSWKTKVLRGGSSRSTDFPKRTRGKRDSRRGTRLTPGRGRGWECWAKLSPDWKPACPGCQRIPNFPNWTPFVSLLATFPTLGSFCRMTDSRADLHTLSVWYECQTFTAMTEINFCFYTFTHCFSNYKTNCPLLLAFSMNPIVIFADITECMIFPKWKQFWINHCHSEQMNLYSSPTDLAIYDDRKVRGRHLIIYETLWSNSLGDTSSPTKLKLFC